MIIQPIQITQGDYGYPIPFTLLDGNGNAVNLTGTSLALKVQSAQDPSQTLLPLAGSMAIDSATAGTCHYTVANGDFPNPGSFYGMIVVTGSGSQTSYPGVTIVVNPSLPKAIN